MPLSFLVPVLVACQRLAPRLDPYSPLAYFPRRITIEPDRALTDSSESDKTFPEDLDAWAAEARGLFRKTRLHTLQVVLVDRILWHLDTVPEAPLPAVATAFQALEEELVAFHRANAPTTFSLGFAACHFDDGADVVRCTWSTNGAHHASALPPREADAASRRFRRALVPWTTAVAEIYVQIVVPPPSAHERAAFHRGAAPAPGPGAAP